MAFGRDVLPEEKGRCSDASNKHRKRGDPEVFISVFLPGPLEKYADALFLEMLTSPQLIIHSLLPRQGLGNRMGKLRHGEASQDGLPKVQDNFARPASIVGTAGDVPWAWSCPRRQVPWWGPPHRGDAPASVSRVLHKVPLSLASGPCAQGPARTLFTASACEPFPSPVGGRVRPGAFVNARGAAQQLQCAGSPALPSLCHGIGFSRAVGLHTTPSTRELSFANRTKPDPIKIPTGAAQLPARSVLRQPLANIPSWAGVGSAEGRLAQADHRCLRLSRWRFCLKMGCNAQNLKQFPFPKKHHRQKYRSKLNQHFLQCPSNTDPAQWPAKPAALAGAANGLRRTRYACGKFRAAGTKQSVQVVFPWHPRPRHWPRGVQTAILTARSHHSAFFGRNPLASSCGLVCTFPPPKPPRWVLNGFQNTPSPPRSCPPPHEQGPHRLPVPWLPGKGGTGQRRAAQDHPKSGSQAFGVWQGKQPTWSPVRMNLVPAGFPGCRKAKHSRGEGCSTRGAR